MLDVEKVRRDFPILGTSMNGKPLAYLDSAATSQKPLQVIESVKDYYSRYNANIHRGIYRISEDATEAYVESKGKTARLINAKGIENIVYTRNATESLNVAALTYAEQNVGKGDTILLTEMEHHSNIVPWQMLAERKGASIEYVRVAQNGTLDMADLSDKLSGNPRIVSFTHASNVLGTVNDAKRISRLAHESGATVIVDGAQSVPHMKVDVQEIGCDFLAFSAHKMLGPTGLGVLYAKADILEKTEPLFGGGDMINTVEFGSHTWNELPWKFEAGTPNIAGAVGFGTAIDYLNGLGMESIADHERRLTKYALDRLSSSGVRTFGPDDTKQRVGVVSFAVNGVHPHDVSQIFDDDGIAIRAGHHCAMPLVKQVLKCNALSRMSFYVYNTEAEIDRAADSIERVRKIFKVP